MVFGFFVIERLNMRSQGLGDDNDHLCMLMPFGAPSTPSP